MKTGKIIIIAGLALIAVALFTASAFAYMGRWNLQAPYGTNTATGTYGTYSGGMMNGGMMGGRNYNNYPQYGAQQTSPTSPYGGWGCHGRAVGTSYASP